MHHRSSSLTTLFVCIVGVVASSAPGAGKPDPAIEKLFAVEVLPLLRSKCFACHGDKPDKIKGGLNMLTRDGLLKGGEDHGAAMKPGDRAGSPMFTAVTWSDEDLEMPPKENDRLTPEQIELIGRWIDGGAPWPSDKRIDQLKRAAWAEPDAGGGITVPTSGGLDADWTNRRYQPDDLWAFQPIRKPPVPDAAVHPVDAFVDRKLAEAGVEPAPRADRATLIRRATYDLLGLPPTPQQIRAFLDDDAPDAWPRLIDRLLASPHYGERWGQHWLDVARYADTAGFSNDWERSNAWRYRDYVVRAFNGDKPYNRFILEQIAGDELDPDDPEMRVAVGFLRMGPWEHTGMVPESVSRQQYLDDVVNSIGQTFLATPLRCAKCHDHKFDPIPTRDYYRVYAALATTQPSEMPAAFLDSENRSGFEYGRGQLKRRLGWAQKDAAAIKAKEEKAARAWAAERGIPYVSRYAKGSAGLAEDKKPPRFVGLDHRDQGVLKVRQQDARIWSRRLERYEPMAQSVHSGGFYVRNSIRLRPPASKHHQNVSKRLPEVHVYAGGDVYAKGEPVMPGVLSALPNVPSPDNKEDPWALPSTMTGRRLALARWIADEENPVTARVMVNRIWQQHFGLGIAANANNFGKTGAKPSHPDLLDFLATHFMNEGWSIRRMHRLIMTSEAYRRSSAHPNPSSVAENDPNGLLLAHFRPRRLSAEELRDSMLVASGELTRDVGGLPIFPEINLEVALAPRMIQFSIAPAYQPSRTPAERNRRSIYIYRGRGLVDPMSDVFNKPTSDTSCERRDASTVTPQVFTMMNSGAVADRSIAMARRLEAERKTPGDRIDRAFALVLGRAPSEAERGQMQRYLDRMIAYHGKHQPEPTEPPKMVTRSLVEELSGKSFEYTERLDAYDDYVPHARAWDVSPRTRALADVCLVLFNTNEFIYIY